MNKEPKERVCKIPGEMQESEFNDECETNIEQNLGTIQQTAKSIA